MSTEATPPTNQPTKRKTRQGVVSSAGGNKTIQVEVENLVKHPRYGKYLRRKTKVAVHDRENTASVGDLVEIVSCRRLSKTKSYRLLRVVRPASLSQAIRRG